MRRAINIMLILLVILLAGACQRRPFAEYNTRVALKVVINTNIVNHVQEEPPQIMRVNLYDPETGSLRYTDFVGPTGGYIHPTPGVYDMIVYSVDSESTVIRNERNFNDIEAYTNEVSSYIKGQMAQFLAKRKNSYAKASPSLEEEPVVNQPDHIFVGWYHTLDIPVVYEDDGDVEIVVEVDAHTLVETWVVEVRNIEGVQWISSTMSVMSGQKGSVHMGPNAHSDKVVSVVFDLELQDREDGQGKCLKGKLNTFGVHPENLNGAHLDLNIRDKGDADFVYHFDVTDQFRNNEKRYILVEQPIVVEQPKVEGGGFQPTVDIWKDVHTEIIL
jgi:hypothetical protein